MKIKRGGRSALGIWLILILMALMGGCGASQKEVTRPIVAKSPPSPSPAQPEKLEELVVPMIEERKKSEKLLSFSLRDADIRETLLSLSKTIGSNIILDPDVSGKVTAEVKRVTPEQALEVLLATLGLQYKIEDNYIRISKPRMETRVFTLNYIGTQRTGTSSFSTSIGVGGGGAGGGTITSTDSADLWGDIEKGLKDLVSEGGKITINRLSGVIVASDFPANLNRIAAFLEQVEGSVQRQVMIQAKVVDVVLSDDYQMGLDWSAISKISGLDLKGNLSEGKMFAQSLNPGTGVFQMALSDGSFSMLLDAMSRQGKVNILSSPKISVINNQKAAIKVVRSEVFFDVSRRVDLETKEKSIEATSKTVDVGVVLEVTPQISNDGQVMMNIHPVITEKVGESTFESADLTMTSPVLTVRETNTVVRVPDGNTIVIAGLIQEKESETKTKVPGLGNVPILGGLFRNTEKSKEKNELVIFLTPTVLTGKRIEELSREDIKRLNMEL